ncbi:MAG: RDD family protein [Terracidiphilus sp.]
MQKAGKAGVFNPHETARADSLAGVPLASFGRRLVAYLIDMVLVFGTYGPAMAGLRYLLFNVLGMRDELYRSAHVTVRFEFQMVTEVAWVLWLVLYFGLIVWKTNGLTLGKRLTRIRVVSLTHEKIAFWQSVERALGYGASALEAGFGFLQYFFYPNHRCVHDRIAETIVVLDLRVAGAKTQAPAVE